MHSFIQTSQLSELMVGFPYDSDSQSSTVLLESANTSCQMQLLSFSSMVTRLKYQLSHCQMILW